MTRSEDSPVSQPPGGARTLRGAAWRALPPLTVASLTFLTFVPALSAGFVGWDDTDLLFGETRYRALEWKNLAWMFSTSAAGHFQPLTWLSFAVDWMLWGPEPFGFHLTNVALHAGSGLVFYFLARRLTRAAMRSRHRGPLDDKRLTLTASFAAGLFALHPLRVESVAWVAERRDVLGGVLFLLSVWAYLIHADRARRGGMYVASLLFCGMSLLAKAGAVVSPVLFLVLDGYPLRRQWRLKEKVPFLVLSVLAGWRAIHAQQAQGAWSPLVEHDLISRLSQACYGVVFYAWKTLVPAGLSPLYELPERAVLLGPKLYGSATVVAAMIVAVVALRRRVPALAAAAACYVVILSPVLGFLQSGPQLVADRYSYLSCLGFALLGGAGVTHLLTSPWARRSALTRGLSVLVTAAGFTALHHAAFRQCDIWRSGVSLWTHAVQVDPNSSIAHANLADALAANGELPTAIRHYQVSLDRRPNDPITLRHFADTLRKAGDLEGAVAVYERLLRAFPGDERAVLRLAELWADRNEPARAAALVRRFLSIEPRSGDGMLFLAELLSTHPDPSVRDGAEALSWATRLQAASPLEDPSVLLVLASALAEAGRTDDAVTVAIRGLELPGLDADERVMTELNRRMKYFVAGKPYHFGEPPPTERRGPESP